MVSKSLICFISSCPDYFHEGVSCGTESFLTAVTCTSLFQGISEVYNQIIQACLNCMLHGKSPNGGMKVEINESVCTCSHRPGSFLFILLKKQQKGNSWLLINVKGSSWDGKGTKDRHWAWNLKTELCDFYLVCPFKLCRTWSGRSYVLEYFLAGQRSGEMSGKHTWVVLSFSSYLWKERVFPYMSK